MSGTICSKRAKKLVALAKKAEFFVQDSPSTGVFSSPSEVSSTAPSCSPPSPWWEGVFEAADIKLSPWDHRYECVSSVHHNASVKRKLFLCPEKDDTAEIQQTVCNTMHSSSQSLLVRQGDPMEYPNIFRPSKVASNLSNSPPQETSTKEGNISHQLNSPDELKSPPDLEVTLKVPLKVTSDSSQNKQHIVIIVCSNDKGSYLMESAASASINGEKHVVADLHSSMSSVVLNTNLARKAMYSSHQKIYAAKVALNSGKEHITSQGIKRDARYLKSPCQDKCRRCKYPRLTEDERRTIFKTFWEMNDHVKQWTFISESITISQPKRKFVVSGSKSEKHSTRAYSFNIDGKLRKVCKLMFKNTPCICDSWVNSALLHCSGPEVIPDGRGKNRYVIERL